MSDKPPHKSRNALATVAEFEVWLSKKKTDHNYEFMCGQIIKKDAMKQNELFIVKFLTRLFSKTADYQNGAELIPEIDVYIDDYRKRVPDLACFSAEQIKATRHGAKVVPAFVIELLSDSRFAVAKGFNNVENKIQDYFDGSTLDAGVQVVWYINPKTQTIYSYTSPKTVTIGTGADVCSAAPTVVDFRFEVQDLFK